MKVYFIFITFCITFSFQPLYAQEADKRLGELLNHSDWFTLDREFPGLKAHSQVPFLKLFSQVMLEIMFDEQDQAIADLDSLLTNYQEEIGFTNTLNMVYFQNVLRKQKGEYEKAYEEMQSLIEQISAFVNPEELPHLLNLTKVLACLQNEKPPHLIRPAGDIEIPFQIEEIIIEDRLAGHQMLVNVELNGNTHAFIFDTGAEFTFLSEKFARENRVRFLCDSIPTAGAVAIGYTWYGMIDQLAVNNIRYENAPAIIAYPNEAVDTILKTDAVLGRDFMKAMGEIHIYPQEKKIIFPGKQTPLPDTGRNMIIESGQPWIELYSGSQRLIMHLDTGAAATILSSLYFQKNRDVIEGNYPIENRTTGGFGGVKKVQQYRFPEFPLQLENTTLSLENVAVRIEDVSEGIFTRDGVLGMDFILKCRKLIINFNEMFISVEL